MITVIPVEDGWAQAALYALAPLAAAETAWQDQSLCAETDPEVFFPEKGGSTREAKRTCRSCEVRAECLEYALEHDERFGIWGGMSERERRRLKRQAPGASPESAIAEDDARTERPGTAKERQLAAERRRRQARNARTTARQAPRQQQSQGAAA